MKEAIEILTKEMQISQHFAKYPQDRHKEENVTIKVLITTSEYHKKRANKLEVAIKFLNEGI